MNAQPSRLSIESRPGGTLAVAGVIDAHTADELLERLRTESVSSDVVLDLAEVEFMDSSGLRTIVTSHQALVADERRLELANISEPVRRLLEITGLTEHLYVI